MMNKRVLAAVALAGAAWLTPGLSAQPVGEDLRSVVETRFELANFSIQRLDLPADNVSFVTELDLGGVSYGVWVDPQSFRTESARATTVDADGNLVDIPLPAPLTVRGQVEGVPEARAAGSRMGGGLHLTVVLPGAGEAEVWTVQPLYDAVEGADPNLVVVSRADDMQLAQEWTCGVPDDAPHQQDVIDDDSGTHSRGFLVCETATDADFEFYGKNGSSETNTIADIDTVMARVSAVYEGQCNVTFVIPHYQIWTTSSDPYTSTDSGTRLTQVRNWWQANMGAVHRDLCHAFTGVNIDGSVIGIAWLSAVCGSNGYGLVQSRFTAGMNARGALSAHEIGHNFSSAHCDGDGDCHIMCSGLGGCNGLGNPAYFGSYAENKIANYAAGRPCLDEGGLTYPFLEEWPDAAIDTLAWIVVSGAEITDAADNEPSSPYSLNLDGTDSIESDAIDLSNVFEAPFVSVYAQHKGVESGKTLICEYRDFFNNWNTLITFTSDGNDQTGFAHQSAEVPIAGWSENFAVRFSVQGADSTDDWYIDDISIAPFAGNAVPFVEEFGGTTFDDLTWNTTPGAEITADATNEPSDPYSMNLDNADSAESRNFLMSNATFPSYLSFYSQHKGVESGKSLLVEYLNINGVWNTFATIDSDGTDQNGFAFYQDQVPFDSYHDAFAFRFTAQGADGTDDWYVDDIRLGDEFTPPDDCYADCNEDGVVNTTDVLCFLNLWNASDAAADCNGDGSVNTTDVLCFLNLWNAGC